MVSTQKVQCKVANQIVKEGGIDEVVTTVSLWIILLNRRWKLCFQQLTNTANADWEASGIELEIDPLTELNVGEKAKMKLKFENLDDSADFINLFE